MPILGSRLIKRGVAYLLRERWTSGTLGSPRTATPGPGTLTVTDAGSKLSISASTLAVATGGGIGSTALQATSLARTAGRMIFTVVKGTTYTNPLPLGWWKNTTLTYAGGANVANGLFISGANMDPMANGAFFSVYAAVHGGTTYQLAIVLRGTGAFYFMRGGDLKNAWTLQWVDSVEATTPVYPTLAPAQMAGNFGEWDVRDLGGSFATDYGIASQDVASPVSGTSYVAVADGIFDLTFTAPNPLTATSAHLFYRYQDASNYYDLSVDASGNLKLDVLVAGARTNRIAAAVVIVAGATVTVRVRARGPIHTVWYYTSAWNFFGEYAGPAAEAKITIPAVPDGATGIVATWTGGYTVSRLTAWPWSGASAYALLPNTNPFTPTLNSVKNLVCDGDSLTLGTGSTGGNTYPAQLNALLSGYTTTNLGSSSRTAADRANAAVKTVDYDKWDESNLKNIVIAWMGTNDIIFLADAATTYANLIAYCTVRRALGWKVIVGNIIARGNFSAGQNTIKTTVNASIAANWPTFADGYVDLAADSRLSNSSDTTYYDPDTIHLNNTGYGVVAALFKPAVEAL
jgi:lysophospholipase L1-like esterase